MELIQWGKLMLSFYRYLGSSINAIDKFVLKKCLHTSHYNPANPMNVVKQVDDVAQYIDKKRRFINLKVIIQDAIIQMPSKYRRLLILEYFDNVTIEQQADLFKVNVRTVYRYKKQALASFASALLKLGYTCQYFESNYEKEVELFSNFGDKDCSSATTNFSLQKMLLAK